MMCRFITFHSSLKKETENEKHNPSPTQRERGLNPTTALRSGMSGINSGSSLIRAGFAENSQKYAWAQMAARTGVWSTQMETVKI